MPASAISNSNWYSYIIPGYENCVQIQQQFQQLGQDLQSGNLSAAQSDSVNLDRLLPQFPPLSTSGGNTPIGSALSQLSEDLQAGNLSAAKQDYSTLQQDLQEVRIINPNPQPASSEASQLYQMFTRMEQEINPTGLGLLSRAQVYGCIQGGLQEFQQGAGMFSPQISSQAGSNGLSVLA